MVASGVGNVLDGIVDLVLDGRHEGVALLEEFAFGAEVFLLQVGCLLLFLDDGVLLLFLLLLGEEDHLVLVVLIECLRLGGEGVDFCLPLLRGLVQLFVGSLVGRDILEDIFHIHQCELLGHCVRSEE